MSPLIPLTLGFLGSFHCIGMCGPIALALPVHDRELGGKLWGGLLYNGGRVFTYAVLGALFGSIGEGLVLAGLQQGLSIAIGVLIVASVLLPAVLHNRVSPTGIISRGVGKVKVSMQTLFGRKSNSGLLMIGLLNGLLPCGLVYIAVAGSIAAASFTSGAAYMALFGLGTVPVMAGVLLAGSWISLTWRNRIQKALPVMVVLIGLLFIVRGLDLGIPYVSPKMSHEAPVAQCCHPQTPGSDCAADTMAPAE